MISTGEAAPSFFNGMKVLGTDKIWESYTESLRPLTMRDALHWSNYLRSTYGDITTAIHRGVSYFVGGIELVSDNENDQEAINHYERELLDKHRLLPTLTDIGMDLAFNGNVFLSVTKPITRAVQCKSCGTIRYLNKLQRGEDYKFNEGTFSGKCTCGHSGDFTIIDFPNESAERPLNVINWNPLNIDIDHCTLSGAEKIAYTPEAKDMTFLTDENQSTALETLPLTIIQAMCNKSSIVFDPDQILHLRQSTDAISRSYSLGWGIPRWLSAFKYLIMLLLLERQLESCAKDYMLPIRLLFPDATQKGSDPSVGSQHNMHLQFLKQSVNNILSNQAYKKSSWHMLPQAVGSITLGGDGKSIIPVDLFEYMKGGLLDVLCIPEEFRKSTLFSGANSQPISLRMFEKTWANDALQMDIALRWYLKKCSTLLNWPDLEGVLMRPSIINDPARMQIMSTEVEAGRMSRSTLYRALSIDPRAEEKLLMQEAINAQKFQQELNKRMEVLGVTGSMFNATNQAILQAGADAQMQEQQGMAPQGAPMPPQGAPAPMMQGGPLPGAVMQPPQTGDPIMDIQSLASMRPGASVSVDQLNTDAQYAAQIIMTAPVGVARNRIYSMIKSANPDLHAIVLSMVDQLEQQAKSQGLDAARQGQM